MKHRNVKNLTTWVLPDTISEWNIRRLNESYSPNHPIGWSEWIQTKVTTALNIDQLPQSSDNSYVLQSMLHNKQMEIEKLNKRIPELESKEIGVSDDRIIRLLDKDDYTHFDLIVQKLIDTESENAFNTLQKLVLNGIIESDKSGNNWRLKK